MAEGEFPKSDDEILYGSEANYQVGNVSLVKAGETIAIGDVVYVKESDGKLWISDKITTAKADGIAISAAGADADIYYVTMGKYIETGVFVANTDYYLGNSGALTTTVGDIKIGVGYDANTLFINIDNLYPLTSGWDINSVTQAPTGTVENNTRLLKYLQYSFMWYNIDHFNEFGQINGQSVDVSGEQANPTGLCFSPNGMYLYMCGKTTNQKIWQYNLTIPWDTSTASYASKSVDISSEDTIPTGLFIKPDGTKIFMAGQQNNKVYEYALSTAWDISTASFTTDETLADPTVVQGLWFSPDGSKMISGVKNDGAARYIYQYNLSSAWDLSGSVTKTTELNIQQSGSTPADICFSQDGTRLYICDDSTNKITKWKSPISSPTPWDLSTFTYVSSEDTTVGTTPHAVYLTGDEGTFYVADSNDGTINKFGVWSRDVL